MDSMAQTPDQALKFVNDVPGLSLTLDWAQMVCQDVFHDDILKLLPHTQHIQLRQAARAQLQTPFDRGRIDVKKVVKDVQAAGYEGVLCVEYMNTPGWHGMVAVNAIQESTRMRDELRAARDGQNEKAKAKT
jgi:sugar phosphate isomerase/epimerase